MTNETQYRVWNIINPPGPPQLYEVATVEEGRTLVNSLADKQLTLDWITSNAFGIEEFIDDEWCEVDGWDDDES